MYQIYKIKINYYTPQNVLTLILYVISFNTAT